MTGAALPEGIKGDPVPHSKGSENYQPGAAMGLTEKQAEVGGGGRGGERELERRNREGKWKESGLWSQATSV